MDTLILSTLIENRVGDAIRSKRKGLERNYLGASQLGNACSRAIQYGYMNKGEDGGGPNNKSLRIFETGHMYEAMVREWLASAGFVIEDTWYDNNFIAADGRIQGHSDGIVRKSPLELVKTPCIWECKSMNAKSFADTVKNGMAKSKPVYAAQIALYQAYLEEKVPGVSTNPALFTAINKDTSELYCELVAFDSKLAQQTSDKAVAILQATDHNELLPRITNDPESFVCRFCGHRDICWSEE